MCLLGSFLKCFDGILGYISQSLVNSDTVKPVIVDTLK